MLLAADTGLDDFVQQGQVECRGIHHGPWVAVRSGGGLKHDFYLDKTVVGFPLLPA